uniref:Synaptogyrin 1 n=1 Tax=Serinus canaria TaxID=9135 RepID=A0A8C9MPB0_SERCA
CVSGLPPHQVFSIVVFGSIVNEGYVNRVDEVEEHCIFNRNHNACNYGITVGVLAFLSCLLYLALDAYFPQISSVKDRKKAVLSDIGVSAFWAFLWFVGFCFLTNQWQASKPEDNPLNEGGDAARAAITFSFFSIFTWVSRVVMMWDQMCSVLYYLVRNKKRLAESGAPGISVHMASEKEMQERRWLASKLGTQKLA